MPDFRLVPCDQCGKLYACTPTSVVALRAAAGQSWTCAACRPGPPDPTPEMIAREERQLARAYRRGARLGIL